MSVTVQTKATEQSFPVVLFIMLYKVIQTFETVDKILKYSCSNECSRAVPSSETVYMAIQEILKCDHCKKASENYFPVVQDMKTAKCGSLF